MLAELCDVAGNILGGIMPAISREVESVDVRCCAIPFGIKVLKGAWVDHSG